MGTRILLRGHVQMTSVRRGGGGVSQFLTIRGGGCVISILKILTGGGGGSEIPKIRLTSFVHSPQGKGLAIRYRFLQENQNLKENCCCHSKPLGVAV